MSCSTRLACAGPISRLLEHLRMQDPSSAPSDDAAGATGMSAAAVLARDDSAHVLASKAARQLVLDTAAKRQAAEDDVAIHLHGGGGMQVASASKSGSQVLNVSNLGLSELPQDVFDAGACFHGGNFFWSLSSSWVPKPVEQLTTI
jgi:hypothetical protein